jgi:hypothetical protein
MISVVCIPPGDPRFHLMKAVTQRVSGYLENQMLPGETFNSDFLVHGFVAMRDGQPVARAALYNNPSLEYNEKHAWCAGNYEAVDDPLAATTLLAHLAAFAKIHGARYLMGPMNGSTWDAYRFNTDDQLPPFFLEPRHPIYYNDHFLMADFAVIARYHSNIATAIPETDPALITREHALRGMGVSFREIDLNHYEDELKRIHAFNAIAFSSNFLYTPIDPEAFLKKYAGVSRVLNPRLTMLAEDRQSNLIGYYFCVDDLLNPGQKSLIFKTLVRHPAAEWRGLGHVMGNIIYRKALEMGYETFIHPFIYNQGTSVTLSRDFEGKHYRSYVLYGKEIR